VAQLIEVLVAVGSAFELRWFDEIGTITPGQR
jgi:hypothetical protein